MTCRQALTHKSNVAMFKILLVNRGDNAFGIWKKMTSDEKQTNAMELAALFNGAYQKNTLTFPTLQGDSVTEEIFDNITPLGRKYLQEVLIGLRHTSILCPQESGYSRSIWQLSRQRT